MTRREPKAANFDRVAPLYRWMEHLSFGRSLERCRNHFLTQLSECHRALLLGDGDGRFLARLLAANPGLCADAVDSSATMLRLLERRADASVLDAGIRLRTHHSSALNFKPDRTYDLIVTHFFLDCLTQPEVNILACDVACHVRLGGRWVVSEFHIPDGAMHWPAAAIVGALYLAFRLLTGLQITALPDYAAALNAAGFTRIAHSRSLGGLLSSELWEYTPAMLPPQKPKTTSIPDPVPDPEPASPSLPEPDPGVFQRESGTPMPDKAHCATRSGG